MVQFTRVEVASGFAHVFQCLPLISLERQPFTSLQVYLAPTSRVEGWVTCNEFYSYLCRNYLRRHTLYLGSSTLHDSSAAHSYFLIESRSSLAHASVGRLLPVSRSLLSPYFRCKTVLNQSRRTCYRRQGWCVC